MKRPFVKLSYWKNNIFFVVLPALRNNLTLVFAELIQSLLLPAPWVFAKISSLSYYIYKTYSSVNTDSHRDKTKSHSTMDKRYSLKDNQVSISDPPFKLFKSTWIVLYKHNLKAPKLLSINILMGVFNGWRVNYSSGT